MLRDFGRGLGGFELLLRDQVKMLNSLDSLRRLQDSARQQVELV
jgi:hypothetical protein